MKLFIDLLFWALLTAAVFAGCYWLTSELGRFAVRFALASAASVRSFVLGSSLVLTPCTVAGLTWLLTRR